MTQSAAMDQSWLLVVVIWLICATVGSVIAQWKNRNRFEGFILGLLLGLIGIAIESLLPTELPPAPAGSYAYQCPRCNAVQNVRYETLDVECWRCHRKVKFKVDAD